MFENSQLPVTATQLIILKTSSYVLYFIESLRLIAFSLLLIPANNHVNPLINDPRS